MSPGRGVRRRESFDAVAELYDRARPAYPPGLVDDLIDLAGIGQGARVLEIGAGTGQLTVLLAERGVSLVALELGPNLARVARRKLAPFEHAEVVGADFDEWVLPAEPFDLVVAATAFHWLDPATRLRKCADALRPGGTLAIVDTTWGIGHGADRFFAESQLCYARWDPHHDPDFRPPTMEDLPVERDDLAGSRLFAETLHRRYLCDREYDATRYCELLGTFSNVLAFDEPVRRGFLSCIADLIVSRFAGRIVRHDLYELWLARTLTNPEPI
ncbi:MAG: class I SAM-dependent methyltransferase [Candidatus Eisenbacteria bacterium]|nr:class I SAM-dependent methyltransferase [Candidatus Eisenbacteria bacterium]